MTAVGEGYVFFPFGCWGILARLRRKRERDGKRERIREVKGRMDVPLPKRHIVYYPVAGLFGLPISTLLCCLLRIQSLRFLLLVQSRNVCVVVGSIELPELPRIVVAICQSANLPICQANSNPSQPSKPVGVAVVQSTINNQPSIEAQVLKSRSSLKKQQTYVAPDTDPYTSPIRQCSDRSSQLSIGFWFRLLGWAHDDGIPGSD